MAVTSAQIVDFLTANPGMTDAQIVAAMEQYGVSPAQMAQAVGLPVEEVATRYVTEQILGQGTTDKWAGQGKGSAQANAVDMAKIIVSTGATDINQFGQITKETPVTSTDENGNVYNTGETQTVTTYGNKLTGQEVPVTYGERQTGNAFGGTFDGKGNTGYRVEFDAQGKPLFYTTGASSSDVPSWVKPALILGAAYFGLDAAGLLGGAASGAGATGLTLAELGGTAGAGALTAAESAALYGTGASALGTAGVIGSDLAGLSGIPAGTGALTAAEAASLYGTGGAVGTGLLTAGGAGTVAGMGAGTGITAGAGGLGLSTTGAGLGTLGTGAGITAGTGLTGTGVLTGSGLGSTLLGTGAGALTGTGILTGSGLGTTLLGTGTGTGVTGALTTGVGTGLATGLGTGALTTGVGTGLGTALGTAAGTGLGGLTAAQLGALLSGGLTTGAGLLQQQTSREAAIRAQQMIDTETAAAKQAAAFRPVGMTTRFGTSQFQVDPRTGQITSAGYTLSPEAKNAQDRLVKLAESGLQQAEGAQAQFAPLQTGAQNLFNLGNQYLAQSPQDVAQNYLNQQMALLQPGRELELANLQTKLRNQGRMGLSVAQGGNLGATTPELQALYNARATQEAQLAAQAQQAGQQQVLYGAGLLGQGTSALGNYYAGQQAAYQPYTTALGQVQGLETAAQQPLIMGAALGQQAATAGANVGRLGLSGADFSTRLATGPAATTNPYSTLLSGLGASPAFGQALGGLFS